MISSNTVMQSRIQNVLQTAFVLKVLFSFGNVASARTHMLNHLKL